jgi:hypothetical protein
MTITELITRYEERRREAERIGATAPLAQVYALVHEELSQLDSLNHGPRLMRAPEVAQRLGISAKTVANRCGAGKVPDARKSSTSGGVWLIPSTGIAALAVPPRPRRRVRGWTKATST